MQVFQPHITLIKAGTETVPEHFLHVTTLCDQTGYIADGNDPLPTITNAEGLFPVILKISLNTADNYCFNKPINHFIPLTNVPLSETDPWIEVTIKEGSNDKGKGVVHIENAESDSKPEPIWEP